MTNVIVITGASSGFGLLSACALAHAGHTVYAGMRETAGRNAPQVAAMRNYATEHAVDLRSIDLDVASRASVDTAIARSSPTTAASMLSYTTPATWPSVPQKPSRRSSWPSSTTSMY